MPHVSVSQKYAVKRIVAIRRYLVQFIQLFPDVWCCLKKVLGLGGVIDDGYRTGLATKSRLIPGSHTVRFIAVGLRVARILRNTEDINVGISCRHCRGTETQH